MFGRQCLDKVRRGQGYCAGGKERRTERQPPGAEWCWACGRHTGVCPMAAGFGVVGTHCVLGPLGWDPCGVGDCTAGLWWHTRVR